MGWLIPAALGLGAVGSYLGGRSQANAEKDKAKLYNDWLKNYQRTGQGLYNQAQGAGWNPFGPHISTSQNTGTSSMQGGSSFSNRPVITGEYAPLDQLMRSIMTGRLSSGSSLPPGYASTGIQAINQSHEGADQAARNLAARRGLSAEQTYAVASPANRARAGQIASFRANLPLLEREMQNQDIGLTADLQRSFGTGQQGQSSTYQSGQTSSMGQSSSPFTAGDLSALMNVLMPPGPQQTTQTGFSPVGQGISSLGSLMGFLAANQGMGQTPPIWGGGLWGGGAPGA